MGLLVFERLDVGTTDMKVVVPEVRITDNKVKAAQNQFRV